jgi:hypothetical protein
MYSDDLAGAYLARISDDPASIRLGAFDGDSLVGMVIGAVGRYHPFSPDLISSAYLLYVDPAHRGSRAVVGLVKGFIAESRDRGAKDIVFGTSTGVEADRFGALMVRLGMKHVGGIYAMET